MSHDYYQILGITRTASPEEVKKAYQINLEVEVQLVGLI